MDKGKSLLSFVGWLSALLLASGTILTFIGWLLEPRFHDYIVKASEANQNVITKIELAEKMQVKPNAVIWKLGKLFRESNKTDTTTNILKNWIDYLEEESMWIRVGYYVDVSNPDNIRYLDVDGKDYDSWEDELGRYYIKRGYKYYK